MKLPLGEAMLFSYAGIVSATVAVGIKIEFSGEARYTYKNTTVTTYTYFDGECSSSSYEKGPVHDFNAKCEFKAGAYIELNVCFLCVSLLHAKAFIGLEAKAEFKIELGETKPVNMLDCVEIAIDLIVEVKLTVGIGKLEIETADFKLIDLELARLHYHFLDEFYTFNPETNELIWAGKKDRFHSESDCPYDVMTVKLMFPWLSNQLHASYDVGLPGTPFNKPEDPDLSMYDRRFLAWHTRADLGENSRVDEWPYMVNESVSLYADSAILYDLNFVYTNGKPVCKAYKAIEGEEVALPTSDRRHTITGWIVIDDDENMTQLDRLDEGATEFSMPDDDVWLCAICPDDIVINFYTGIGTDARSVYCSRNEPVQAPEFVLSRPRHKFIGWTDADGNEVVFPFTPDRNSPAVVSFHALWEYTGEMTASDLDGNDFGYVPSTSDFGEKQSGTEYFYYEVSEGEVTITGFRYDSKESPKNLYIPSTINGDKVTRIKADAFKGLSTLKAVTLSEYIEEIGAGAFSGCTDLRLIDMSYVINLSHIPNSFARECYNLVCVMMPSGVRSYGASSFFDCSSLAKVNIEGQVGDYAFANCKSLSEVNFGKAKYGNTSDYAIGSYAFYQCLALKEIVIPDCVNDIGSNFISGNKNIESVVFDGKPETITSGMMQIGEGSKLSSLTLGDGVRALGNKALANGDKGFPLLKTLAIPASVTSIGESALMGSGIEKLELYSPELVIGKSILNNCADIKEVIVHAGTIGSYAFSDNQSIEKVVIGQAVKAVEPYVFKNCSALKTVEIRGGNIKYNALAECSGIEEVIIGGSPIELGNYCFNNCPNLKKATIGESVESIGDYCFNNCVSLNEIVFEEGVKSVGSYAFRGCTALKSLAFPDSVTQYGYSIINGCVFLEELTVGGGNPELVSTTTVYPFYIGETNALRRIVIREGVESIGEYYFSNRNSSNYYGFLNLETIVLPDSLKSIGQYSFYKSGIRNLIIPQNVKTVGIAAFLQCERLESLEIYSDTVNVSAFRKSGVRRVTLHAGSAGDNAFESCDSLEELTIGEGVTSIGAYCFRYCVNLKTVNIAQGVSKIGREAFSGCVALKSIAFPDSVTDYGLRLLYGCTALEELTVGGGVADLERESTNNYTDGPFFFGENAKLRKLTIREGVSSIGEEFFSNTYNTKAGVYREYRYSFPELETVILPSSLKIIGVRAFYKAGIKKLIIPENTETVNDGAFANCNELETLEVYGGSIISAFWSSGVKKVYFHAGTVGNNAFSGCDNLEEVVIGENVYSIGDGSFSACKNLRNVTIEEGIIRVGDNAFRDCISIKSLSFPDSVTKYGVDLIYGCTALEELTIGGGCPELKLTFDDLKRPYRPFNISETNSLKKLVIREGVTFIGDQYFADRSFLGPYGTFSNLESVRLPSSLNTIGYESFFNTGIKELIIPEHVETVADSAFASCSKLQNVSILSGVIGKDSFSSCRSLKTLHIGSNVTSIGTDCFYGCSNLENVTIDEGIKSVGYGAFRICSSLKSIVFPDSVTDYNYIITEGCSSLEELTIGGGQIELVANIGNYMSSPFFVGETESIRRIIIREGVVSMSEYFLSNIHGWSTQSPMKLFKSLETLELPESLTRIEPSNISKLPSLRHLKLGSNITYMSDTGNLSYLTLYTDFFNPVVDEFAKAHGCTYIYDIPMFKLTTVYPQVIASNGLSAVNETDVAFGSNLSSLSAPTVDGYLFDGWFTDEDYQNAWTGGQMPYGDLTLYAKYLQLFEAKFVLDVPTGETTQIGGLPFGFVQYKSVPAYETKWISAPDEEPWVNGFGFAGWFYDREFTKPWSGQDMPDGGTIVYGHMARLSAGGMYKLIDGGYQIVKYSPQQDESTEVFLPSKIDGVDVVSIADYAFSGSGITYLRLPRKLKDFDDYAFCGMEDVATIDVSGDNENFTTKNGVLYSKDMKVLYRFPQGRLWQNFSIPESVTRIAPRAFDACKRLREVTFPNSLSSIGDYAFSGCLELKKVALADDVTEIGDFAFEMCSSLVEFRAVGLTLIGEEAIPINLDMYVYGEIGPCPLRDYCMSERDGDSFMLLNYNIYFADLIVDGKSIAKVGVEAGQKLPSGILSEESDDGKAIMGVYKDAKFTTAWDIDADIMPLENISLYIDMKPLFEYETRDYDGVSGILLTAYHGTGGDIKLPRVIGETAIMGVGEDFLASAQGVVRSVDIGPQVIFIADTALNGPAEFPFGGVVKADDGSYAASWAENIGYTRVRSAYTLSFSTNGASIPNRELAAGTAVRLPTPVKTGSNFLGWFLDAELSVSVTLDGDGLFTMPTNDVTLYASWDIMTETLPYTYTQDESGVTITGYSGTDAEIAVPGEINGMPVIGIGDGAFANDKRITKMSLPQSVKSIGVNAFSGSSLLKADLGGTESIGDGAFARCYQISKLSMPCARSIGEGAFNGCAMLKELTLPDTLNEIKPRAFAGCEGLSSVTLPDGLTILSENAFLNCVNIKSVFIGAGLISFSKSAFNGCQKLAAFSVSTQNASLRERNGVLYSLNGDTLLAYPQALAGGEYALASGVSVIAEYAFSGAESLKRVELPNSLTKIGEGAFKNSALSEFSLSGDSNVTIIPKYAFSGCASLREVSLNQRVLSIESGAFMFCPALEIARIIASTTEIDPLAFGISDSLTIVGKTGSAAYELAVASGYFFTDPDAEEAKSIEIVGVTTMYRGETAQMSAIVKPDKAVATAVKWYSGDENVILASDGIARAVGSGSTTVYAQTLNGLVAELDVEVLIAVDAVTVTGPDYIAIGDFAPVETVITPQSATDKSLTFSTDDPETVSVDENGILTGVKEGKVNVMVAAHNSATGVKSVTSYRAVESVLLNETQIALYAVEGLNKFTLTAQAIPENATYAAFKWTSSDESVCTVDENGVTTAFKPGEAVIRATADDPRGAYAECAVTVGTRDISGAQARCDSELVYNGAELLITFAVTMDGLTLARDVDYTVSAPELVNAGEYTAIIAGINNYSGELSADYVIDKATPVITYTGDKVYAFSGLPPTWTVVPTCQTSCAYARLNDAGEPESPVDAPTSKGRYSLLITAPGDDNCLAAQISVPIIIVDKLPESSNLSSEDLYLEKGQNVTIEAIIQPADADYGVILWRSDDERVAKVDGFGNVTTFEEGTTIIHAQSDIIDVNCVVTVGPLRTATLPRAITQIDSMAFINCERIQKVVMGNATEIGDSAFADMYGLRQIVLPETLTEIGENNFTASDLTIICKKDTVAYRYALDNGISYVLTP